MMVYNSHTTELPDDFRLSIRVSLLAVLRERRRCHDAKIEAGSTLYGLTQKEYIKRVCQENTAQILFKPRSHRWISVRIQRLNNGWHSTWFGHRGAQLQLQLQRGKLRNLPDDAVGGQQRGARLGFEARACTYKHWTRCYPDILCQSPQLLCPSHEDEVFPYALTGAGRDLAGDSSLAKTEEPMARARARL